MLLWEIMSYEQTPYDDMDNQEVSLSACVCVCVQACVHMHVCACVRGSVAPIIGSAIGYRPIIAIVQYIGCLSDSTYSYSIYVVVNFCA